MSWMTDGIRMDTEGGGIGKVFGRMFSGETLFRNRYTAERDGEIAFASSFPGSIIAVELSAGRTVIAQKRSFLASDAGVDMEIFFQKRLGKGFFGGEGLFNTCISSPGKIVLQTMPVQKTAMQLYQFMPHPSSN